MNALASLRIALLLVLVGTASRVAAGQFSATSATGAPGASVSIDIQFAGEATTADAQVDIAYDASVLTPSPTAANSGSCRVVAPGILRVLTSSASTGVKPTIVTTYCVASFAIASGAASGPRTLATQAIVCSDVDSNLIACGGTSGQVTIAEPAPEVTAAPPAGSTISFATTAGATDVEQIVVTNDGDALLSIASCNVTGAGYSVATSFPLGIMPTSSQNLSLSCTGSPGGGTTVGGSLECSSNDADEPLLTWPLSCVTAPASDVDSTPAAGVTIALAGQLNGFETSNLVMRNTGPANLAVACSMSGSLRLQVTPPSFGSVPTGTDVTFVVSCDLPSTPGVTIPGTLTCTTNDPDEPTLGFPVTCATPPGPRFVSLPSPGTTVTMAASSGQTVLTRRIAISNGGSNDTTLTVAGCATSGASQLSVLPGSLSVPQGAPSQELVVTCQVPAAPDTTVIGGLVCTTNDAGRSAVGYPIVCVSPPPDAAAAAAIPRDSLSASDDASEGALFGTSVAAAEPGTGTIVAVGAPQGGEDRAGRVFVFDSATAATPPTSLGKRIVDGAFDAMLSAPKGISGDKFGRSVAVSRDGATIAIGAPGRGATGEVHVFTRPSGGWTTLERPDAVLTAAAAAGVVPGGFGEQVAFTADGTLVVGAPASSVDSRGSAGAAFVFTSDGSGFAASGAPLRAISPQPGATFGSALAAHEGIVAIGAPQEDFTSNGDEGATYTFTITNGAASAARLVVPELKGIGDKFGSSVALAQGVLVAGAPAADTSAGANSGAAIVFVGELGGTLLQRSTLLPAPGAEQGAGTAVATNGDTFVLGAPLATVDGRSGQGRAFLYENNVRLTQLAAPARAIDNLVGAADDRFGSAIAIGRRALLIGVPRDDNDAAGGSSISFDEGRVDPYALDRIFGSEFE